MERDFIIINDDEKKEQPIIIDEYKQGEDGKEAPLPAPRPEGRERALPLQEGEQRAVNVLPTLGFINWVTINRNPGQVFRIICTNQLNGDFCTAAISAAEDYNASVIPLTWGSQLIIDVQITTFLVQGFATVQDLDAYCNQIKDA